MEEINAMSRQIQELVTSAEIPGDLKHAIQKATETLKAEITLSPAQPDIRLLCPSEAARFSKTVNQLCAASTRLS